MIQINLKRYYPYYTADVYIEVPDAIAIELHSFENQDAAYRMRTSRNRAYYSLDRGDELEREMLFVSPSSEDSFFREHLACSLFSALQELPIVQARRIYAHYILGMSNLAIARNEGVNESKIRKSIMHGLRNYKDTRKRKAEIEVQLIDESFVR